MHLSKIYRVIPRADLGKGDEEFTDRPELYSEALPAKCFLWDHELECFKYRVNQHLLSFAFVKLLCFMLLFFAVFPYIYISCIGWSGLDRYDPINENLL